MLYACLMYYTDDRELLHRVRLSHRAFLAGLLERGSCVAAGSFVPADDGGLFLYEAPDLAAAEAILAQDPYVKHGVAAARSARLGNARRPARTAPRDRSGAERPMMSEDGIRCAGSPRIGSCLASVHLRLSTLGDRVTSTPTGAVSYRATRLAVEVGRNLARFRERYEHAVPLFPLRKSGNWFSRSPHGRTCLI